jgi:hypothetical protein
LIDKDDLLETPFNALGSPDLDAREALSRAADEVVFRMAAPPCLPFRGFDDAR